MTSRERVLTALDHREPDRVPVHADFTPEVAAGLSEHLKLTDSTAEAYSGKVSELPLVLGHDILVGWHGIATSFYQQDNRPEYVCEWGIKWRWVEYPGGKYTEMVDPPLADDKKLASYKCPDGAEERRYDSVKALLNNHGRSHGIVGAMPCTLFEAAWYLRGMDRFLTDLVVNKDFAHELLDKIFEFQLVTGTTLAGLGVDIIWMGDDFGTQESLIVSPGTWREFFKPRYARLIEAFRKIKPDVKIAYHSDGNIEQLLPEYIEIGVDILNAVQPQAMDPAHLKKRFGKSLGYWGTMDIQDTFPRGGPEDVENEVKLRVQTVGRGGGLILGPSHNFQPDVPLENILAFYRAVDTYG
ncbi:MAG: uroporphyrinogen decarboxylase family protein, partial [Spirochaetota bacterium]